MRRIPPTIATQHPDNALAPYWADDKRAFISVYKEIIESVMCFSDLEVSEYMWDWEGKHADAAVIDRLFTDHYEYFSKNLLGRDKFLTFRIPNIWEEKGYNLLQAMTVILSSEDLARDLKFRNRPLFEVILPMTERADQVLHMQKLFEKLAKFKSVDFTPDRPANTSYLELIPLIESVEGQMGVKPLLEDYIVLHRAHFGHRPEYLRVFFACSDSSLSSGLLAGIIGNKLGLARMYEFSEKSKIPIYPFFGPGSLRFRGGLSPNTVDRFLSEFPGVRTVTVQSSFRYDHPKAKVKTAISRLEKELPLSKPLQIPPKDQEVLEKIANVSSKIYQQTLNEIIKDMKPYFDSVPKRRERRQHIGLLAYSRSLGSNTLPRAITFTAAFYSIGVPPEFIAAGRSMRALSTKEFTVLSTYYPNLKADFIAAGRYLNKDNLRSLSKKSNAWQQIENDVQAMEKLLGVTFQPKSADERKHQFYSSELLRSKSKKESTELVTSMAKLRRSLG